MQIKVWLTLSLPPLNPHAQKTRVLFLVKGPLFLPPFLSCSCWKFKSFLQAALAFLTSSKNTMPGWQLPVLQSTSTQSICDTTAGVKNAGFRQLGFSLSSPHSSTTVLGTCFRRLKKKGLWANVTVPSLEKVTNSVLKIGKWRAAWADWLVQKSYCDLVTGSGQIPELLILVFTFLLLIVK